MLHACVFFQPYITQLSSFLLGLDVHSGVFNALSICLPQLFTTMSSGNAQIGKPAPEFKATAVVDGQFKEIKLSDYKGVFFFFFF